MVVNDAVRVYLTRTLIWPMLGMPAVTGVLVRVPACADELVLHQVQYVVTADRAVTADIYFRDTDPPTWADYSHNPYQFSPKMQARLGPGQPWIHDVMLADPDHWAMVTATSGLAPETADFHCTLAVDGVVADTSSGARGALCSIRLW